MFTKKFKKPSKYYYKILVFSAICLLWSFIVILCMCIEVFTQNSEWGLFDKYEWGLVDLRFNIRNLYCSKKTNDNIVIIDIDEFTLGKGEEIGQWPFPRSYYASLVKSLTEDGAKVICLDILLSEHDRIDINNDLIFAKAMKETKNVILPMEFSNQTLPFNSFKQTGNVIDLNKAVLPVKELRESCSLTGFVDISPESDGIFRKVNLKKYYHDKEVLYFSLAIATYILNVKPDELNISADNKGRMFINYQGGYKTFTYIPFYEVYKKTYRKTNRNFFKDKYVIIGSSASGLGDLKATPVSNLLPGVEVQATVLNTILNRDYIFQSSFPTDCLLIMTGSIITACLLSIFSPLWSTFLILSTEVIIILISFTLFMNKNFLLTTVPLCTAILICYITIISYRLITEERQKRKLRHIFQRYVSPQVVNLIVNAPAIPALGGERKKMTILFSDIRNFTPMSEKLKPEEVVHVLNEYFTSMAEIIFQYDGTIDKFIGDCIMAFWGAPIYHRDDALRAVKTALGMKKKLQELQKKWEREGKPPVAVGIGINTGEVVVGNIGSPERMEYTTIGDEVNLASRLQSIAREGQIFISNSTYREVYEEIEVKELTPVKVKGKSEPVILYEVTGIKRHDEK
jgi:adenylate cyclase